ncbi:MAG TPA: transposase [Saliniramus sp.]|nr:transposase [Saliniramus sp.]
MMERLGHGHRGFRPANRDVDGGGGFRRRRVWSAEDKALLVSQSNAPDANVSEVARRAGVSRGLLNEWRREAAEANEAGLAAPAAFVPVEVVAPAAGCNAASNSGEGSIDIDVGSGRVTIRGAVDATLARAVLSALRG